MRRVLSARYGVELTLMGLTCIAAAGTGLAPDKISPELAAVTQPIDIEPAANTPPPP